MGTADEMDAVGYFYASPNTLCKAAKLVFTRLFTDKFVLSKLMNWQYSRDRPVFGSIILLENIFSMCDVGEGSAWNIGWSDWY